MMKSWSLNPFFSTLCTLITLLLVAAGVQAQPGDSAEEQLTEESDNNTESGAPAPECFLRIESEKTIDYLSACLAGVSQYMNKEPTSIKVNASYALGARFYRDVVAEYEDLDFAQFLIGTMEEAAETSRFKDADLDKTLSAEILSTKDKSDKFVKEFALTTGVDQFKGIYFIDRTPKNSTPKKNGATKSGCTVSADKQSYSFQFNRLQLGQQSDGIVIEPNTPCITLSENEIIRGWRTALKKMDAGKVWQILIPASLAYGDQGISSEFKEKNVEPGEALHFLIRKGGKS